jgi:hypothetical protein
VIIGGLGDYYAGAGNGARALKTILLPGIGRDPDRPHDEIRRFAGERRQVLSYEDGLRMPEMPRWSTAWI